MQNIHMPAIPKISGDCVMVQDAVWQKLINYVQTQTDTINELIQHVESLSNDTCTKFLETSKTLTKLQKEVSTVAEALQEVYTYE